MSKQADKETGITVRYITQEELKRCKPEDVVWVNRIQINSKSVELTLNAKPQPELAEIITDAIQKIQEKDRSSRRICFGAEMPAEKAQRLFANAKSLPYNSLVMQDP